MCGQSVSRRKVEVAVLTADKVVGWCVNANALPKGVSDAFHVRRAAMKHGECLGTRQGEDVSCCCLFLHI